MPFPFPEFHNKKNILVGSLSPFPMKRLNVFKKMQQQHSVQYLQTAAAMSDLRQLSLESSVRSGQGRGSHHREILPPRDSSERGQEEDRQGRDRDGRERPRREERKGRQGV